MSIIDLWLHREAEQVSGGAAQMTPNQCVFHVKGWLDQLLEKKDGFLVMRLCQKRGTESKAPGDTTYCIISVNESVTASCIRVFKTKGKKIQHEVKSFWFLVLNQAEKSCFLAEKSAML